MANIPILMYHHIAPIPDKHYRHRALYVSPKAFKSQMTLLEILGYKGLSMSQAIPYLCGKQKGKVAVITLDDGYLDNLEYALPILEQHNFSATCYTVSATPSNTKHWRKDHSSAKSETLMTPNQLRLWYSSGMEIGAHTRTHPHLTRCNDNSLREEIHTCKHELEDLLGTAVTQFCYPYGDHDDRVVKAVRLAGFTAATTTIRGRACYRNDILRLPRIPIRFKDRLPKTCIRIVTAYEDRLTQRRRHRVTRNA